MLRNSPTGPGCFAIGVPLRELGVVLPDDKPMSLNDAPAGVPEKGTVYFVTFAEARKAAVKSASAPKAQAKKVAKAKKTGAATPAMGDGGACCGPHGHHAQRKEPRQRPPRRPSVVPRKW